MQDANPKALEFYAQSLAGYSEGMARLRRQVQWMLDAAVSNSKDLKIELRDPQTDIFVVFAVQAGVLTSTFGVEVTPGVFVRIAEK